MIMVKMKRLVSIILAVAVLSSLVVAVDVDDIDGVDSVSEEAASGDASGAERDFEQILAEGRESSAGIMSGTARTDLYQYYFNEHRDKPRPNSEIVINMADFDAIYDDEELEEGPDYTVEDYQEQENCLLWNNDVGCFEYSFNVEETGIYNLEFLYYAFSGKNNAIELGVLIDDEYLFSATRNIELDKYWKNDGVIKKDTARDNELLPMQIMHETWITYPVKDKEGLFNEPYFFYLEKGEHTLKIEGIKIKGAAFKSLTFKNYPDLESYVFPGEAEVKNTPKLSEGTILLQGQEPYWRSSTELIPTYDNGTYLVSPSHPVKMRYNTVGGNASWAKAGQSLTWEFTVPADGYYRFSAKFKQNMLRGFNSNRRILINGEVPCEEFNVQKFPYKPKWQQKSFTDSEGNDIYIELKEGVNYITLEVVPGEIGEVMQRLDADLFTLNHYYRRILMIVGPNPDEFNPYYVDSQIPELISTFEEIRDRLREEKRNIEKKSSGSEASTLETMAAILQLCIDNPVRIPLRMKSLKDNIGALSAWIREKSYQPIELDYIEIATAHEEFSSAKVKFGKQLSFLWRGFIGSFTEDFTTLGDGKGMNVWVGLGRDQALCLKRLVDNDFNVNNPENPVAINLVQGSILEASLAGKGPEVALFIGGDFPVQLAARKLTVDLTQFDDYKEIASSRFTEQLPTFFTYLDGVYGLPLSQMFPMMFYRTDILADLDLDPPKTWDEFIEAIAILNRAYLEIGLVPPTNNLTSTIFEPGETFTMLQLQTGQNFYVEDKSKTTFNTEESIAAFTMWTRFYTVYQFEQTYDPFTRFRTGEMPIVIQNYGFYNMVNAAAPEIRGLWDFQHVPGTMRTDEKGEEYLDISASSASACGLIFNKAKDKDAAWEFLKWLTSDDVQTQFGQNMEAMLGPLGRYDTANKNALANLAWSARELRKIETQRDALVEIPMIPANYSATRHIKNAFRAVVNESWRPRYSLESYNRDINAEIERKNKELASH